MVQFADFYILSAIALYAALFPTGLYQRALTPIASFFKRHNDNE